MPITGVFFIPSGPNAATALAAVTERLHSAHAEEPLLLGRWSLEHKLMRDTPSCLPSSKSQGGSPPRYMHFLSLTFHPNHGFIYTSAAENTPLPSGPNDTPSMVPTPTPTPSGNGNANGNGYGNGNGTSGMVMTTVPLPACGTLYQHFVYACQPFWCHRHSVIVWGGSVYDIGDFRVRLGDVRQTTPATRDRGTVVQIEWRGPSLVTSIAAQFSRASKGLNGGASGLAPDDDDSDSGIDLTFADGIEESDIDAEYEATAALIRAFWARLGMEGAREAILLPDVGKEVKWQLRQLQQQKPKSRGNPHAEQPEEDPEPLAGTDVARQFMEIFRFSR